MLIDRIGCIFLKTRANFFVEDCYLNKSANVDNLETILGERMRLNISKSALI
jgi:hypothetical protein